MRWNLKKIALAALLLSLCEISLAGPGLLFSFSTNNYVLHVNTIVPNHKYEDSSIQLTSTGYTTYCPSSGKFISGSESCHFTVSDTLTANFQILGASGPVDALFCLNGSIPAVCQKVEFSVSATAFITNFADQFTGQGGTVSECFINDDTSPNPCIAFSDTTFYGPLGMAINTAGTYAYIANWSSSSGTQASISICPIDQSTGQLNSTCTAFPLTTGSHAVAITLNNDNTLAYIADSGNSKVIICPIISNGASFGTCTSQGGNFNAPQTVQLNPTGNYIYLGNYSTQDMSICPINPDGTLGTCTRSNGDGTFNIPSGMRFRKNGTIAYISNQTPLPIVNTSTISICDANPTTGALTGCIAVTDPTFKFSASGSTLIFIGDGYPFLFAPNTTTDSVSVCPILPDNLLAPCVQYDNATFDKPGSVNIR